MSIELVMPSNHLILCCPLLLLLSASGSFQMSQFFASGGQSTGVSASALVPPMNIQDWSPLGLTGWISLQSKRLSGVFSNTTIQKHQFFMVSKVFRHWWQWWLGIWFYGLTIGDFCQLDDDLVSEESGLDLLGSFAVLLLVSSNQLKNIWWPLGRVLNDSWNLDWWTVDFLGLLLTCSWSCATGLKAVCL